MKLETQALRPCGSCYDTLVRWAPGPYPLLVIAALILRAREDRALAGRSGLILPSRDTERLQRTFQILWRGFALRPGCDPGNSLSRGYDYFFFFEVFFATFLVAAFALFFAFFAFLAMWSSAKNWLSESAHAVNRRAQH
jgi:hypothetical protein